MIYAGTAWVAGLVTAALFSLVPAVFAVVSAVLLLKILLHFELKSIIFMLAVFCISVGYYNAYGALVYTPITNFDGKEISYCGTITDFKDNAGDKSVYYLSGKINGKISAKLMVYTDALMCETGDSLNFECNAEIPENSFLFNSKDYYKSKGIYLHTDSVKNLRIAKSSFSIRKMLYRFREKVNETIDSAVPNEEGGMIKGMLFGDKSEIYEDDMTMLYRTGIGHVTAVSGLHLVLFCTLISFFMRRLNVGIIIEFIVCELFMLLFILCCGMSVSVVRAFLMMTLVNLAPIFFRYTDSLNSVCIAVIVITLQNPFVISNSSFLLSVSGALGAGVFAPYITANMRADNAFWRLLKNGAYLMCVSIAVTPMSVLCFGEMSLISPFSNLIIVPACMAAILIAMTASLLIFIEPKFLFKISGAICRMVLNVSRFIGSNRFTHIKLSGEYVKILLVILILFCIATYLVFISRRYTLIAVLISVAIIFSSEAFYNIVNNRIIKIAMLGRSEVGVIVISRGFYADVIDICGQASNGRYASKYLDDLGISEINSIMFTKNAYSSISAYNYELDLYKVKNVIIPVNTYVMSSMKICGCKPKYSDFLNWSSNYGDYKISVNENSVSVNYGAVSFECRDGGDGIRKYKPNTVLYISDSGKSDFRRLEND